MLPIVLVLLFATSTLSFPGVLLTVNDINDVVPPEHNGGIVSAFLSDQAFEIIDGGEVNPYTHTAELITKDLANQADERSQALALGQTISLLGTLATGIPGDACAAANIIDAYVLAVRTGNYANLDSAVSKYIKSLLTSIDLIVGVATNRESLRYETGPRGNCKAGGRTYQFEAAWDSILSNASPGSAGLVNEQYCAAKRLYHSFSSQSNNAGAAITAASLPIINGILIKTRVPVAKFVAAVSSGNPAAAAAAAKKALAKAAGF